MQTYALAAQSQSRPAPSVRGLRWSLDFSRMPRRNHSERLGNHLRSHQVAELGPSVTKFGTFTTTKKDMKPNLSIRQPVEASTNHATIR